MNADMLYANALIERIGRQAQRLHELLPEDFT
jgi:hypothetical protein